MWEMCVGRFLLLHSFYAICFSDAMGLYHIMMTVKQNEAL